MLSKMDIKEGEVFVQQSHAETGGYDCENETEFSLTPVQLEPFLHQVGGHSSILSLDEGTICKPLISRELQFYETMPTCLKPFTPEYRGVIQVRFVEDADGYIRLDAYAPKSAANQLHRADPSKRRGKNRRIRLKKSGSIDIQTVNHGENNTNNVLKDLDLSQDGNLENALERRPSVSLSIPMPANIRTPPPSSSPTDLLHNPWAVKCQKSQLNKLQQSQKSVPQNFLLLENITRRFDCPCVVDLKMGRQQYGDDASENKIKSKSEKAGNSTSVQLGVRICGMQVYQVSSRKYICRDKYYGQKLNVSGFQEGLSQFLHNGCRLRLDALGAILAKLKELRQILLSLETYRFYTSSLLLAYEGFQDKDDDQTSSPHSVVVDVDIRMIDFAHSTFSDLNKNSHHEGPDAGYIFGLSNLISTLEQISDLALNDDEGAKVK